MARARGDADDARGTTGEEGEAEGRASATKIFGVFEAETSTPSQLARITTHGNKALGNIKIS